MVATKRQASLVKDVAMTSTTSGDVPKAPERSRFQFSLSSLLLLVTLFSVWMGLLITVPCLALAGLVFFSPAMARAVFILNLLSEHNEATSALEKLSIMGASMMLMLMVYLLTIVAAISAASVGSLIYLTINGILGGALDETAWESVAVLVISAGTILLAVYVAVWLMWTTWPRYSESLRKEYF